MVVGNGMLATAFIKAGINTDYHIIFASGVSNSFEKDPGEFNKETDLLLSYKQTGSRLVYFSTVSIYDPSLSGNPYIQHKLNIEKIIKDGFSKYLIIRLPNVVGRSNNPNTLTNFFYLSLINDRPFNLYLNASRYLIDLEDVVRLTSLVIQKAKDNQKINLVLDNKMSVPKIVKMLSEITGKRAIYKMIAEGSDYEIDDSPAKKIIGTEQFRIDPEEYNFHLLSKYYGQASSEH
ncbi:MAG: NAD-dependent epimerase/dehydratase family protein [Bacteroidales bacterium]|nr:NAD-dependent epimerase/dehydratase family protein [Bacteroidales bacterium]